MFPHEFVQLCNCALQSEVIIFPVKSRRFPGIGVPFASTYSAVNVPSPVYTPESIVGLVNERITPLVPLIGLFWYVAWFSFPIVIVESGSVDVNFMY